MRGYVAATRALLESPKLCCNTNMSKDDVAVPSEILSNLEVQNHHAVAELVSKGYNKAIQFKHNVSSLKISKQPLKERKIPLPNTRD